MLELYSALSNFVCFAFLNKQKLLQISIIIGLDTGELPTVKE
jgi:hypothetical protein